jgi:membrane dipeptidase
VEGAQVIDDEVPFVDQLWKLGVRSIGLTHFSTNGWADASSDVRRHGGVSALGREAIAEMNRLGMMVDLSHASDETFWQALDISTQLLLVSHSCVRALHDHPRNLSDDMIVELAKRGGLFGVTWFPEYLYAPFQDAIEVRAAEIRSKPDAIPEGPGMPAIATVMRSFAGDALGKYNALVTERLPMPSIDVIFDHVDHAVRLAGVDHVCLGSDQGAVRFDIPGLESCAKLQELTRQFLMRGYSPDAVRKIMGGNVLAFMERTIGS